MEPSVDQLLLNLRPEEAAYLKRGWLHEFYSVVDNYLFVVQGELAQRSLRERGVLGQNLLLTEFGREVVKALGGLLFAEYALEGGPSWRREW